MNAVVENSNVLSAALDVARQITSNSPDSVQSSKEGLILAQKHHFEEAVLTHSLSAVSKRLYNGENIKASPFLDFLVYPPWSPCCLRVLCSNAAVQRRILPKARDNLSDVKHGFYLFP